MPLRWSLALGARGPRRAGAARPRSSRWRSRRATSPRSSCSSRTTSTASRRTGSAYASIYFTLLGAHAAHVAAGILLELWVLARLVGGLTRYRLVALQVTVFYWVFVNVLAVIVVAVQLSPRL